MSTSKLVAINSTLEINMPRMTIGKNLAKCRGKAGLSQAALAKISGVSQQLISQIEKDKNTSTKYLPQLANALGVKVAEIDPSYSGPTSDVRMVRVLGYVQAGEWEAAWEWPEESQYEVPVRDEEQFHGYPLLAVETKGESMNKKYPEGTVLVYSSAVHTHEDLKPGKRYIVERQRADGDYEATVKTLFVDNAGKSWLVPESTDPTFESISLENHGDDHIRIIGQVRYAVTRE